MKTLIVYYSLEGNTKMIANRLADMLCADTLELTPSKAYPTGKVTKFLFGGKSAVMSEMPVLEPYGIDPSVYDAYVFGTPVWAGRCTPPLRTFLNEQSFIGKKTVAFACAAGSSAGKTFDQIEQLSGVNLLGSELFISPNSGKDSAIEEKLQALVEKIGK